MSLDKSIQSKKEHRKKYYGSKAIDCTCRNHGTCEWCKQNRLHSTIKKTLSIKEQLGEFNGYFKD